MYVVDRRAQIAVAVARVVIGVIFLWAGLAKFLGAGDEGFSAAGFLQFGTGGTLGWPFVGEGAEGPFNPTADLWMGLAGNEALMTVINFLVVFGQIAIGIALILGIFTRFAAAMGALMMLFFFLAAWEFEHGIVNQHLTYTVVTFGLAIVGAGNYYGLDAALGDSVGPGIRSWLLSGERRDRLPTMA